MENPFNFELLIGAAIGTGVILYLLAPAIPTGNQSGPVRRTGLWFVLALAAIAILIFFMEPELHFVSPDRLP